MDEDVKYWSAGFTAALLSHVFASLGFRGTIDLMELGGFMAAFGTLMIAATVIENQVLEN